MGTGDESYTESEFWWSILERNTRYREIHRAIHVTERSQYFRFYCDPAKSPVFIFPNWEESQLFYLILSHKGESFGHFTLNTNTSHSPTFYRYNSINLNLVCYFCKPLLTGLTPWDSTHPAEMVPPLQPAAAAAAPDPITALLQQLVANETRRTNTVPRPKGIPSRSFKCGEDFRNFITHFRECRNVIWISL